MKCYLSVCRQNEVTLSFSRIEEILGSSLPSSAYTYQAWWANGGHSQANAWLSCGFTVGKLDLPGKTVTFRKSGQSAAPSAPVRPPKNPPPGAHLPGPVGNTP